MQIITEYTRSTYRTINRNLLNGIVTEQAAELIEVVSALPATPGMTYRTFNVDHIAAYVDWLLEKRRTKQTLTLDAFTSTSRSPTIAAQFNGNVKLTIQGKTGRDIAAVSDRPAEQETLYLPGLTCKIAKVKAVKFNGKVWSVDIDLIEL